jgi:uncharacterized membrane protein HdeD (DUF308 family)
MKLFSEKKWAVYGRKCGITNGSLYMFAGVVARLTVLVILTLVISMLVLLVLIGTLVLVFCDRKRKNKQSPVFIQVTKLTLSLSTLLLRSRFSSLLKPKVTEKNLMAVFLRMLQNLLLR